MIINYNSFLHLLFIGIIALFPVVNPIGSALIISPFFAKLDKAERKTAVRKITFYSFIICTVSLFAGHYILELFGISIPVVQLAGGIMICKIGWESLSADNHSNVEKKDSAKAIKAHEGIDDKLFYPITFPVTVGAGTLSVLFTLSANNMGNELSSYIVNTGAILLAIIIICILVYIFYLNTERIIQYLGASGEMIVNRLSAFLIFCVGLQIAFSGINTLIKHM
jgi:multiple antibiotic resistance protein